MEEFKIGDMVLYRIKGSCVDVWRPSIYVGIGRDGHLYFSDGSYLMPPDNYDLVPLTEENIKYLGSCKDVPPRWEPEPGEIVAVKSEGDDFWRPMVFIEKDKFGGYVCSSRSCVSEPIFTSTWFECEPIYKHFNVPKCPEDA